MKWGLVVWRRKRKYVLNRKDQRFSEKALGWGLKRQTFWWLWSIQNGERGENRRSNNKIYAKYVKSKSSFEISIILPNKWPLEWKALGVCVCFLLQLLKFRFYLTTKYPSSLASLWCWLEVAVGVLITDMMIFWCYSDCQPHFKHLILLSHFPSKWCKPINFKVLVDRFSAEWFWQVCVPTKLPLKSKRNIFWGIPLIPKVVSCVKQMWWLNRASYGPTFILFFGRACKNLILVLCKIASHDVLPIVGLQTTTCLLDAGVFWGFNV